MYTYGRLLVKTSNAQRWKTISKNTRKHISGLRKRFVLRDTLETPKILGIFLLLF